MKYYYCQAAYNEGSIAIVGVLEDGSKVAKYDFDDKWIAFNGVSLKLLRERGFRRISKDKYAELCFLNY